MKQFKYIESKGSDKLHLDQYYTPTNVAKYCIDTTLDVLGEHNYEVDHLIEPSSGSGSFSDILLTEGYDVTAIDLEPKKDYMLQGDFLTHPFEYSPKTLIIGNPPYGTRLSLAKQFYRRSVEISDYISFILPISQLNNTKFLYEFDLIHSEDLGIVTFSDSKKVPCCLNIYVRPSKGINKKSTIKLKDVEIIRQDSKRYNDFDYDIRMCYWGNATAGKILKEDEHYSGEYKIKIHNNLLREDIIKVLSNVDWKAELNSTAMCRIKQYHIFGVLKKYIKDIN